MTGEKRICEGFLCEGDRKTSETGWVPLYNGTNADLAARAARRASYAAIDQDAASKQIEELLMKNVAEAKKVAFLSGANQFISEPTLLWSFYLNVKKNAVMDYKKPNKLEQVSAGAFVSRRRSGISCFRDRYQLFRFGQLELCSGWKSAWNPRSIVATAGGSG